MRRSTASWALLVGIVVLVLAGGAWWMTGPKEHFAPAVDLRLTDGRVHTAEDLKGRVTLISFWSPTCAPCVKEIPEFKALYQELHAQGLQMLAVTMPYDPPGQVIEFARQRAINYPIALDIEGKAAQAYGVQAVPRLFVIDRQRRIVLDHQGPIDMLQLRPLLVGLLAP